MSSASRTASNGSGNGSGSGNGHGGGGNTHNGNATVTSSARATKKSAFSCEPCRRRKVKCGGEQPICSRCLARNDACVYKLNPTLSYTQRLEERIRELEDQLSRAWSQSTFQSQQIPSEPAVSSSHDGSYLGREPPEGLAGTFRGLKLDERGVLTYHGATSFFHLPSEHAGQESGAPSLSPSEDPQSGRRERLVNNAWQQRALEDLSDIPEPFQYLLNTHWCWIQPLFNFIYRPAFTRDMQLLGPYYSHTLLNAILCHSVRWGRWDRDTRERLEHEYDGGAVFGRHARTMVFDEVSRGVATIPTVQTLLLLSAQECSQGNTSQAWMYSGMAFRMIDHLGICVDSQRYDGGIPFSDEDVEIRRRLFWSCYLYPDGVKYPPIAAHSTSCFMRMCRLSVIFNQILIHMYDPLRQNSELQLQECLVRQEAALREWWEDLPAFLKIEASVLPPLSPPSHVVTLNCLYHTFNILLHRPMLSRERSSADSNRAKHLLECVSSATSIIAIFDLFCKSFGIYRSVLSLSYSVYIAASIFLLQVQAAAGMSGVLNEEQQQQQQPALRKLDFCIRALSRLKDINPIVGSAVGLVLRELANLGIQTPGGFQQDHVRQGPSPPHSAYHHQQTPSVSSDFRTRQGSFTGFLMGNTSEGRGGGFGSPSRTPPNVRKSLFQCPDRNIQGDKIDHHLQHHGISDQVFEAVSSLQPISASFGNVGAPEQHGLSGRPDFRP